jgi:hypothetical protein
MTDGSTKLPRAVLVYGLLGIVPFWAPPVASVLWPHVLPLAGVVAGVYGALILSFLGGARWGLEVMRAQPRVGIVSLAMLPTLIGLVLLLLPAEWRVGQLWALAAALGLHWLWDVGARGLPPWYPRLRTILTLGAITGLAAMAVLVGHVTRYDPAVEIVGLALSRPPG